MAHTRAEYIRCGKNCRGCPHGPYWYEYSYKDGRLHKRYLGKDYDPRGWDDWRNEAAWQAESKERPAAEVSRWERWSAIFNASRATTGLAREILGVDVRASKDDCRRAFLRLVKDAHPDHGGDGEVVKYYTAAWSFLKAVM